jgi:hypothetical protein
MAESIVVQRIRELEAAWAHEDDQLRVVGVEYDGVFGAFDSFSTGEEVVLVVRLESAERRRR